MLSENNFFSNSSDMAVRKNKLVDTKELGLERFSFIKKLREKFPEAQIYIVGGAVRDFLLGHKSKDFDFIVRGVAPDDLEKFLSSLGHVDLVGKNFGVFKFMPEGGDQHEPIDIALPRTEHALGTGGYRDFEVQSDPNLSVEEDLSRRDFTINAIALDITNQKKIEIVDPFNGLVDLKNNIIRAVGQPEDRFKEDYSRLLRAIRFACQTGFQIEEKTWQAVQSNINHLNDFNPNVEWVADGHRVEGEVSESRILPNEVIAKELLKAFTINPIKAFDLYFTSGAFKELIPELFSLQDCQQPENFHSEGDVWTHTRLALEKLTSTEFQKQFSSKLSPLLVIAVLFHDLGKPATIKTPEKDGTDRIRFNEHDITGAKIARQIAERLKLSSPEGLGINIDQLVWLVQHHMILVQGDIDLMREATIEKYFFNPDYLGDELLKVSWADISATISQKGEPDFTSFNKMLARIERLKALTADRQRLPPALLDGHEIMRILGLKPGPKIGETKDALREEQLSGRITDKDGAVAFIRRFIQ